MVLFQDVYCIRALVRSTFDDELLVSGCFFHLTIIIFYSYLFKSLQLVQFNFKEHIHETCISKIRVFHVCLSINAFMNALSVLFLRGVAARATIFSYHFTILELVKVPLHLSETSPFHQQTRLTSLQTHQELRASCISLNTVIKQTYNILFSGFKRPRDCTEV